MMLVGISRNWVSGFRKKVIILTLLSTSGIAAKIILFYLMIFKLSEDSNDDIFTRTILVRHGSSS